MPNRLCRERSITIAPNAANTGTLFAPLITHPSGNLLDVLDDGMTGTGVQNKLHNLHHNLVEPLNRGMNALICVLLGANRGGLEGTALIEKANKRSKPT